MELFVESLHSVFLTAALLAFVAFLLSFAIEDVPLRTSIEPKPMSDPFQMPRDATSLEELKRIVARLTARENRWRVYQRSAERLNIPLEPDEFWLLARIGEREDQAEKADLAKRLAGDPHRSRILERLASAGMARKSSFGIDDIRLLSYSFIVQQSVMLHGTNVGC